MPRNRPKKTNRGECDLRQYEEAYEDLRGGTSLRQATEKHHVSTTSLHRYKQKKEVSNKEGSVCKMGYMPHNKVFDETQEKTLSKYLIKASEIYFGLSTKEVRSWHFYWRRNTT